MPGEHRHPTSERGVKGSKPRQRIRKLPAAEIEEPCGHQILLDPRQVKVSSGVSRLPTDRSIAWERLRESL